MSLSLGSCGASTRFARITSNGSRMRRTRSGSRVAVAPASRARASRSGVASSRSCTASARDFFATRDLASVDLLAVRVIPQAPRTSGPVKSTSSHRGLDIRAAPPIGSARARPAAVVHALGRDRRDGRRKRRSPPYARFPSSRACGAAKRLRSSKPLLIKVLGKCAAVVGPTSRVLGLFTFCPSEPQVNILHFRYCGFSEAVVNHMAEKRGQFARKLRRSRAQQEDGAP